MSRQQARVFLSLYSFPRERLADFEKFCDASDRGVGWEGLERAVYCVDCVGGVGGASSDPGTFLLSCSWSVAASAPDPSPRLDALQKTWMTEWGAKPVELSLQTSRRGEWRVLHSYFGSGRQDHRSPLMDQVVARAFVREPEGFSALREGKRVEGLPPISLSAQDAHQLYCLLKLISARKGVEIGTLGGYSAAWIARAIGPEGALISIEKDPKRSRRAAENLRTLGFEERVECRSGDAVQVLRNLGSDPVWDFVFIDADKASYGVYVAWAMKALRPGGLLIADNAYLWGGMLEFPKPWVEIEGREGAVPRLHGFDANEFDGMSEAWRLLSESPEFETWMLPSPEGLLVSQRKR